MLCMSFSQLPALQCGSGPVDQSSENVFSRLHMSLEVVSSVASSSLSFRAFPHTSPKKRRRSRELEHVHQH